MWIIWIWKCINSFDRESHSGAEALEAAIAAVSKYGGATAGCRTLLDALIPASAVLKEVIIFCHSFYLIWAPIPKKTKNFNTSFKISFLFNMCNFNFLIISEAECWRRYVHCFCSLIRSSSCWRRVHPTYAGSGREITFYLVRSLMFFVQFSVQFSQPSISLYYHDQD